MHKRTVFLIESTYVPAFERDRSKCIFQIIANLHEVGANHQEITDVLWTNPYFLSKYGADVDALALELGRVLNKLGAVS